MNLNHQENIERTVILLKMIKDPRRKTKDVPLQLEFSPYIRAEFCHG